MDAGQYDRFRAVVGATGEVLRCNPPVPSIEDLGRVALTLRSWDSPKSVIKALHGAGMLANPGSHDLPVVLPPRTDFMLSWLSSSGANNEVTMIFEDPAVVPSAQVVV